MSLVIHVMAQTRYSKLEKALIDARIAEADAGKLSDVTETLHGVVGAENIDIATRENGVDDAAKEESLQAAKNCVNSEAAAEDSRKVAEAARKRAQSIQDTMHGYELHSQTKYVSRVNKLSTQSQKRAQELARLVRDASRIQDGKTRKEKLGQYRHELRALVSEAGVNPDAITA